MRNYYSVEYCGEYVGVCVCLFIREHISGITRPKIFTEFIVHAKVLSDYSDTSSDMLYDLSLDITRGRRGSVLLSRRCAITDVFPVLWTTSSVHILDHKGDMSILLQRTSLGRRAQDNAPAASY